METPEEKKVAEPTKKFRFANQYVMLTYAKHVDKKQAKDYFMKEFGYRYCEIGHEIGETGYKHSHIVIDFGKRFQSTNVRVFDLIVEGEIIHPNIQPFRNHEWIIKCNYISKQDPENAHLKKNNVGLATKIWAAPTLTDALMIAQKPADVSGIKLLYDNKPAELPVIREEKLHGWQSAMIEIMNVPDRRSINWLCAEGNMGKSWFAEYCHDRKLALVMDDIGDKRDCASIIKGAVKRGWDRKAIILDLARDYENRDIYRCLESLKNGLITTLKYEGEVVRFGNPIVIVLANYWPNIWKMSIDRWKLWTISKDEGAYNIKKAPLEEVLKDAPECDTKELMNYM